MIIRFLSSTFIRYSISDLARPPLGVIHAGTELEVQDRLFQGEEIDSINTYFKDDHGWYYWSGRAIIKYKALPSPKSQEVPPPLMEESELVGGSWLLTTESSEAQSPPSPLSPSIALIEEEEAILINDSREEITPPNFEKPAFHDIPPATGGFISVPDKSSAPNTSRVSNKWHYHSGMFPWGPPEDNIAANLWDHFALSGDQIRIGYVDTTPWQQSFEASPFKQHKSWQQSTKRHSDTEHHPLPIFSLLTGSSTTTWQGLVPNAQVLVASIEAVGHPQSPHQLLHSLEWLAEQSIDLLVINETWTEQQFSTKSLHDLKLLLSRLAKQNVLSFAPIGEGRGLRPINNWPAAAEQCFSVGAYLSGRKIAPSNQRSNYLDFLAPSESSVAAFPTHSPTGLAATYAAGVTALLVELTRMSELKWNYQDWQTVFQEAHPAKGNRTAPFLNISRLVQLIAQTANNW